MVDRFDNQDYLKEEQYKTSKNLSARIRLHKEYGVSQREVPLAIFDAMLKEIPENANILDVGCGRGDLWKDNADRIPDGWNITAMDISAGMIEDHKAHLGDLSQRFTYRIADVQELPFEDNQFDAVLAMYMLYHVPDISKGITEMRRVLKPDGVLLAQTNGGGHMKELFDFVQLVDPDMNRQFLTFTVENGAEYIGGSFSDVQYTSHDSHIWVDTAQPILDYIDSMIAIEGDKYITHNGQDLRKVIDDEITKNGGVRINRVTGLFTARGTK